LEEGWLQSKVFGVCPIDFFPSPWESRQAAAAIAAAMMLAWVKKKRYPSVSQKSWDHGPSATSSRHIYNFLSVLKSTKVYKRLQTSTKVYKSLQKSTKVYKSLQKYTKV
jgi:hypothetical protein